MIFTKLYNTCIKNQIYKIVFMKQYKLHAFRAPCPIEIERRFLLLDSLLFEKFYDKVLEFFSTCWTGSLVQLTDSTIYEEHLGLFQLVLTHLGS